MLPLFPIPVSLPILTAISLLTLTFYLGFKKVERQIESTFNTYIDKAKKLLIRKPYIQKSLVNFGVLALPVGIYLAANLVLVLIQYFQLVPGLSWNNILKTIQLLVIATSATIATYSFRQNTEYRVFENLKQRYEKLRDLLNKDALDKNSLDEAVVLIRSLAELRKAVPLRLFKDLAKVEKNTTRLFVQSILMDAPLFYLTGFETEETKELYKSFSDYVERCDAKADCGLESIVIKVGEGDIDFTENLGRIYSLSNGRALHDSLINSMLANDESTNDIQYQFVRKRVHTARWTFQSGLSLEHIFVLLGFIYDVNPKMIEQRMRGSKTNRLKSARINYPKISACLYYLWQLHFQGRNFSLSFDVDTLDVTKDELF